MNNRVKYLVQFQAYVGNNGDDFMFLTNLDAPKHHVIEININDETQEWDNFEVIVAVSMTRDIH